MTAWILFIFVRAKALMGMELCFLTLSLNDSSNCLNIFRTLCYIGNRLTAFPILFLHLPALGHSTRTRKGLGRSDINVKIGVLREPDQTISALWPRH
jgi:hypothetical protein